MTRRRPAFHTTLGPRSSPWPTPGRASFAHSCSVWACTSVGKHSVYFQSGSMQYDSRRRFRYMSSSSSLPLGGPVGPAYPLGATFATQPFRLP
ncbi:hypothetical protein SPI_06354 [Niveomyces insectorum RCEF 264]|uniref:Uncharacterized protein n=1 Tax=Niveomyces insectorum RCEF 264 TaxID=1081102 RepID=A0A167S1X0_9HYPO|nr:hypothetical protein SPI_06354 [Niveomyces insectorum RCEF 264]